MELNYSLIVGKMNLRGQRCVLVFVFLDWRRGTICVNGHGCLHAQWGQSKFRAGVTSVCGRSTFRNSERMKYRGASCTCSPTVQLSLSTHCTAVSTPFKHEYFCSIWHKSSVSLYLLLFFVTNLRINCEDACCPMHRWHPLIVCSIYFVFIQYLL